MQQLIIINIHKLDYLCTKFHNYLKILINILLLLSYVFFCIKYKYVNFILYYFFFALIINIILMFLFFYTFSIIISFICLNVEP